MCYRFCDRWKKRKCFCFILPCQKKKWNPPETSVSAAGFFRRVSSDKPSSKKCFMKSTERGHSVGLLALKQPSKRVRKSTSQKAKKKSKSTTNPEMRNRVENNTSLIVAHSMFLFFSATFSNKNFRWALLSLLNVWYVIFESSIYYRNETRHLSPFTFSSKTLRITRSLIPIPS